VLALASCGGQKKIHGPGDPADPPGDPGGGADNVATTDDTPPADQDVGDPGGDAVGGDSLPGDGLPPGDETQPVVQTPSTQLCAAGSAVSSTSYHGVVCLSPVGSGGPVSTSASYKLIPGPAHIVRAE
jgi:hypothetical protein